MLARTRNSTNLSTESDQPQSQQDTAEFFRLKPEQDIHIRHDGRERFLGLSQISFSLPTAPCIIVNRVSLDSDLLSAWQ